MMIVHSVPSLGISGGGPPRSVSQLCNAACLNSNEKIGIITAKFPNDPLVELDSHIELTVLEGKSHRFFDRLKHAGFDRKLDLVAKTKSVSLIHQHGIWLRSSHEIIDRSSKLGLPCVVAPRGMLELWALKNSKWKKKVAWALYQKRDLQKATAFHATALSEAESIRRLGFKQPIAVIPNGIVLPYTAEIGEREGEDSPKLQSPSSKPIKTALFLSRINPKKGLPMLLNSWKRIAPEGWRLMIAGNDDANHLPIVEAKIREHGLQDQVEIAGPLFGEAKERAYLSSDLFVLPSYSENFGIVVAEALGYGVPVLTTTGCPWRELETRNCGWWVEPTPAGIEAGLIKALGTSHEELLAMGSRGRALVEQKYQWPGIAVRMAGFYDWILNGGKQPDFVV